MEEEQLRPIERAKTCEVPLVQQCLPNGAVGLSCDPPDSFVEVPVGPEQVRPEMPDDRVLRRRWNQLDDRKPVSHRIMITGGEYRPDFERRPTAPALPRRVDLPSTVHPEMGVQGEVVAEAKELVLAARDHFAHGNTGQTGRCEGGHAEFGSGQHAASKHLVQPLAYPPDGVSLRHGLIVPCQVRARIMTTPSIAIVSTQAGSKTCIGPVLGTCVVVSTRRILSDYPQPARAPSVATIQKAQCVFGLANTKGEVRSIEAFTLGACDGHPSETCSPATDSRNCCGWWLAWGLQGWRQWRAR